MKDDKLSGWSGVGILGAVLSVVTSFFGVIALFVSVLSAEWTTMVGGVFLISLGILAMYLFHGKRQLFPAAGSTSDSVENQRLGERLENLEALICRLDRELNQQIEQSLLLMEKPEGSREGRSQLPTMLMNVSSALEERFQILREIGHGGMGVVIQAYDKQLKEQVAIKVISPLLSYNPEAVERLRREVSAARRITHPNVIRIHDISEANGLSYVSMEYFEGVQLREFLRRHGALSFAQSYDIAIQICEGVEAAHKQGVIHRDLKSQNIIINSSNHIKIIDFGLARSQKLEGMTATGLIMGTPEYMAPEQVAGKHVDERADIYSFGIILYELLTGTVPFTGESAIAIGFKQMKDDPVAPRIINKNIPAELETVVLKALSKDPRDRYASFSEMKTALSKAFPSATQSQVRTEQQQTITPLAHE